MTTALSPTPKLQFIDENGAPLAGGKVWTYVGGTMSTPLATYTDQTGGTANANPVILDSSGRASIWLTPNTLYDFQVLASDDTLVYTASNLSAFSFTNSPTFGDITIAGNETFTGNGRRIKGDMTNTPAVNRLSVQTSVAASTTEFQIIPSTGGASSAVSVFTDPLVAGGSFGRMSVNTTELLIEANKIGAGSYIPLVLNAGGHDALTVATTGVVTIANPCAFSVNRNGSDFTVANDTNTAVDWTTEAFDTGSYFDLSTDRFTPPAGYYQLSGTCTVLTIDGGAVCALLYKNGSPLHNGSRCTASTDELLIASSVSATVYANGTDYFQFYVYQFNGSASTATFSGTTVQLFFCGHRVG